MIDASPETIKEYIDLRDKYIKKYREKYTSEEDIFPIEFYDIENMDTQLLLLKTALAINKELYDLDYIRILHKRELQKRIKENAFRM